MQNTNSRQLTKFKFFCGSAALETRGSRRRAGETTPPEPREAGPLAFAVAGAARGHDSSGLRRIDAEIG